MTTTTDSRSVDDRSVSTRPIPVHVVSLGCARNDVDSEELAARLEADHFALVADPAAAEVVVVNTCGFVESAKQDSIDTLLAAADLKEQGSARAVVAVGCMAERYGRDLAAELPEADAVLGFDSYPQIASRLTALLAGETIESHVPRDRRELLPLAPAARPAAAADLIVPGHAPASGPRQLRRRLGDGPMSPLKIASGCDRRCTFCAIPAFRGSYLSRPADEIVGEARWLVEQGVKEVFLVSENTSSYGKDAGDLRALEKLLAELGRIDGLEWIRVSYLQPAETRPDLVAAMCSLPRVVPYFDLSFQHAAPAVLRRMKRFGDPDSFLALIDSIRDRAPLAGIRSNVIVGFPGETEDDLTVLTDFLAAARMDAVGVFGYSDEDGTAAADLDAKLDDDEIEARRGATADLVTELMDQRAEDRIGERVRVLVEQVAGAEWTGRAAHQGPEVDGSCTLQSVDAGLGRLPAPQIGDLVDGVVVASDGVDLVVAPEVAR